MQIQQSLDRQTWLNDANHNDISVPMAQQEHYDSIDGLRAIAASGIIFMHVKANTNFALTGYRPVSNFIFNTLIPQCTHLVFLFMIVSGFSMCCGYYEKVSNGTISLASFYEKRYKKILPYFALLVLLDIVVALLTSGLTIGSIYEAFANLTLTFSLLPNANISVIGVGWTLGAIFLFYMLFPFYCFLLKTKRRAWGSLVISVIYNIACTNYFLNTDHVVESFGNRNNFLFCTMFFISGGLIYLYRDEICGIKKKYKVILMIACVVVLAVFFVNPWGGVVGKTAGEESLIAQNFTNMWYLLTFSVWLMYSIGTHGMILNNRMAKYLSGISMEIYLCHMVTFRVIEKLHLVYLFGTGRLAYVATTAMVIIGSILFALCAKWFLKKVENGIGKLRA